DNVVRRRALIMYDCATPRSAFRTIQLFEQADAAPADSWDYTDADLEWDEVKPDSVGGYTRDIVCGTQTVTDDDLITADDDVDLHHHFTSAYQSK
ncbi:MAG: hypothetical protein JF615_15980, partial [Asticcacaulis sp.]|nr:hypothetical protein [Asticcacaulis sp.]